MMDARSLNQAVLRTVCGLCLLLSVSTAMATDYYVDTTGSNGNNGLAPTSAWRTIQKAADTATAGDTVYIADGTYNESVAFSQDGTAANPIRFVAMTTGNAIIATPTYPALEIEDDDYLHFEGLTVVGVHVQYKSAVLLYNALGIVFTRCDVSNSYHGFDTEDSELTVTWSKIHDCSRELFQPRTGTTLVILDSELYNSYEDGVHGTTSTGGPNPDSTTMTISRCRIHDNGRHGIRTSRCRATITNCLIYNNGYGAPGYGFGIHSYEYSDTTVEHCTIVNNQQYGIRTKAAQNTTLRNSIVAYNGDYGLRGDVAGAFRADTDYNLLYSNSSGNYQQVTAGANDIYVDPEFLGAPDFRLQPTSPAVDAGTGTMLSDLEWKPRPQGAGVDLGCYEAGPLVYYVRVTGDDSNNGLSPAQAFRTISKAASIVTEDSIVHVGGGSYPEGVVLQRQGTSSKPISFIADVTGAETGDAGPVVVTPPVDQQYGWTLENAEYISLDGFRISGAGMSQANGLLVDNSVAITIKDCEIDTTIHGLYGTSSTLILNNCDVHDTTTAGLWLTGVADADLQVTNLTLTNNGTYGVYVNSCDLNFTAANIGDWTMTGSQSTIGGVSSTLTFDNVTIAGGATAGVQLAQGIISATNTTFSGNGYGLAVDESNVTLTTCTFSGNTVGLYATHNGLVSVTNSTFTGNSLWGASVTPSGNAGETATFDNCTFHTNAGGLALANATDGDVLLRGATTIRDNTAAGLHYENCTLTVDDQAGGANWISQRNHYGLSCHQSDVAFSDLVIQDSLSYGIMCEDSSVAVSGCTLTGPSGIYADANNDSLTVSKTTLDSGATAGWGVVRYGGDVTMTNCIVDGFWIGVYLATANATDDVSIMNVTMAHVTGYGVYAVSGETLVRNTIVAGNGAGYGMIRLAGTLTHSHNVVADMATPFFGTTADATESVKNPQFVDSANGDFHLGVGSPAINAGMDLGMLVPDDMEGNARPSYNRYEIGAYEFMAPNGSLRVLDWQETR